MKEKLQHLIEESLPLVDTESDFLFEELDSLGITTILMIIANEFGVTLSHTDVTPKNFKSLDSLVELINQKKAQ